MKILLNASTINIGGGLFVTVNFIKESILNNHENIEWYYLVSEVLFKELEKASIRLPKDKFSIIEFSPAKISTRKRTVKKIKDIENLVSPDIIYSIGAPSYVKFNKKEVLRLTNPYITHPNEYALKSYNFFKRIKIRLKSFILRRIISKSQFFITQTHTAKKGILQITEGHEKTVAVVPNSLSDIFKEGNNLLLPSVENYIFCLAAPYPHKNIQEIPYLAHQLQLKGIKNFKFVVTIPKDHSILKTFNNNCSIFEVQDKIINVGKLSQSECKEWYLKSKMVFFPTYLETFSATLLESLYLKVPIITTNFDFNLDVAGKYALYFNPNDWETAINQIISLLANEKDVELLMMPDSHFEEKFRSYSANYSSTVTFISNVLKDFP